jgi:hypothetical protein
MVETLKMPEVHFEAQARLAESLQVWQYLFRLEGKKVGASGVDDKRSYDGSIILSRINLNHALVTRRLGLGLK